MSELNITLPILWECYLRAEYLRALRDHHGLAVRCYVGTMVSLPGRPLQFCVRLSNGALIDRMPIQALVSKAGVEREPCGQFPSRGGGESGLPVHQVLYAARPAERHQPLACFRTEAVAVEREELALRPMDVRIAGAWHRGRYLFTVDWPIDAYGDEGHKCAHVVELSGGDYVAYPNNLVCSLDSATVTAPYSETGKVPEILLRDWNLTCESGWRTEETDAALYEVKPAALEQKLARAEHVRDEDDTPPNGIVRRCGTCARWKESSNGLALASFCTANGWPRKAEERPADCPGWWAEGAP